MLVSTHTGMRHLLPAAPPAHGSGADTAVLAVAGVIAPAATKPLPQVECALERAYRRQRAVTSPVPAAFAWRAADRRFLLPHGESSAPSPPV